MSPNFQSIVTAEFAEDRACFEKAIAVSEGWTSVYLCKFLWEQGVGQNYLSDAEAAYVEYIGNVLVQNNVSQVQVSSYKSYFMGEKDFDQIKGGLKKVLPEYGLTQLGYCVWFNGVSPLFLRILRFLAAAESYSLLGSAVYTEFAKDKDKGLRDFVTLLEESGLEQGQIVAFLTHWAVSTHYWNDQNKKLIEPAKQEIQFILTANPEAAVQGIPACSAEGRAYLLEQLFQADKEKYSRLLVDYMEDSAKAVREKVISLLGGYKESFEVVNTCLSVKKQAVRECAAHILSIWNDERSKQALAGAYAVEKSDKLKAVMANILKVPAQESGTGQPDINIIDYCSRQLKKIRGGSLAWLNPETLPGVRYKESDEIAGEEITRYLLLCWNGAVNFGSLFEAPAKTETDKLTTYLNRQDLAQFGLEVLNRWLENGADAKKKWVLALAAALGDNRVISLLKKKIEEWPQNSRGAIACDAIRALALSQEDLALMLIDSVSRKFKFRQVKDAAAAVMEKLAEELGVDPEELSDRIVPDLGFDQRGEQVLDFGSRTFIVRLSPGLELELYDQSGKRYKSLPSPGKSDDEVKAKAAADYFKFIKKQLKTVSGIQAIRLASALATERKWSNEMWQRVFVKNPIMQQYATALIWGSYTEGKLEQTFRYMEDGSFNTIEEEEYKIPAGAQIGLVHPIELGAEEIESWKGQLADYEVIQPFEQLSRPVYRVNETELQGKYVERFGGICLNGLSLLGKLSKYGWYRGSVLDGGWYGSFYKENKQSGIGAELSFSGAGIGAEDQEVTVFVLKFYRAGTVERGSYVYDEVTDQKLIKPGDIPDRVFSEVLLEVDRSTAAKQQINPDWRREAKI